MDRKIRILFCNKLTSSFIKTDFEILKKHFDVRIPQYGVSFGLRTFMHQLFYYVSGYCRNRGKPDFKFPPLELVRCLLWADITFTWFAQPSAYSAVILSKVLRKKSVVVAGGYDVANVPEIGYGEMLNPKRARKVKFILEKADKILPVSNYADEEVLNITTKAHLDTIYLACDTNKFKPGGEEKETIVVTVSYVNKDNIAKKGLETFIKSAKFLPKTRFVLVGAHVDNSINNLRKLACANVEFIGYVSEKELIRWYQRAKVYCQLSYQETFGVSVIEAMACNCIPVVSSKAVVLKEVVGDCGFYVPYGDVKATANAIKRALSARPEVGTKARKRVKDLFSIEKREKRLMTSINQLLSARV